MRTTEAEALKKQAFFPQLSAVVKYYENTMSALGL